MLRGSGEGGTLTRVAPRAVLIKGPTASHVFSILHVKMMEGCVN